MLTAKIIDTKKDVIRNTQEPFIEVEVAFYDGKKVVAKRKYGYPLTATEKEIKAEIKKAAKTLGAELASVDAEKAAEEVKTKADKVVENLKGQEIK